ncbi:hypothetical protein TNCV_322151 [Trichonephila clavipes]|nr:hypothetical protein TNCV_322151 [Trichonephila clavipes]
MFNHTSPSTVSATPYHSQQGTSEQSSKHRVRFAEPPAQYLSSLRGSCPVLAPWRSISISHWNIFLNPRCLLCDFAYHMNRDHLHRCMVLHNDLKTALYWRAREPLRQ